MSSMAKRDLLVVLNSYVSDAWGCGAYTLTGIWFQLKFPDSWLELHITMKMKELLPIVLPVAVWGYLWTGMAVLCRFVGRYCKLGQE